MPHLGTMELVPQPRFPPVLPRLAEWLGRPAMLATVCGATLLIVGAGDFFTGIELPFTILYLLPIGLAAWFGSRRLALALSMVSAATMTAAMIHDHMTRFVIAWNLGGALALFVAASWALDRIHQFVERERALRRVAVEQLRHAERLNVIGTLAAGVAHELGTPLNVIAGCAEFLDEEAPDETVHRRTRMILDQVGKVSSIIRRLLDFGHRDTPARSRISLAEIAESATEMLRSTAGKHGATISLEIASPANVSGNAAELEQVVSNLILNGLQAMDDGGTVRVRVGTFSRDTLPMASISVEDSGRGIPADVVPRIFDPFFTTKGIGEGTGLGLSVSYGIVRDHGGSIDVSSVPGHGSRFVVLLPLGP